MTERFRSRERARFQGKMNEGFVEKKGLIVLYRDRDGRNRVLSAFHLAPGGISSQRHAHPHRGNPRPQPAGDKMP